MILLTQQILGVTGQIAKLPPDCCRGQIRLVYCVASLSELKH